MPYFKSIQKNTTQKEIRIIAFSFRVPFVCEVKIETQYMGTLGNIIPYCVVRIIFNQNLE